MSELDESTIKVVLFSGKQEDWFVWEERFLAKAQRRGFKKLLLGKEDDIPKSSDELDITKPNEKKLVKIRNLNEYAYGELVMSMDISKPSGKVAFSIVRSSKSSDYVDGNAAIAWQRLTAKYAPTTAPSLVKLERQFRQSKLKLKSDPDAWITELEDMRLRLEDMGSTISDDQFYIHILNNLSSDYELQVALLERKIGNQVDPLTMEVLRSELNLRFERLNINQDTNQDQEETALFT